MSYLNSANTSSNTTTKSINPSPASASEKRKPATAQQLVRENVQYLIERLEAGKSDALTAFLDAMVHFHNYSFGNVLLIARQKPDATHVAGMWTWNQLARRVKRGEKGIAILAPMIVAKRRNDATAEGEEGRQPALLGFRRVYVWDVSQTEGAPLPEPERVSGEVDAYLDRPRDYILAQASRLSTTRALHPLRARPSESPSKYCRDRTRPRSFRPSFTSWRTAHRSPHRHHQDGTRDGGRSRSLCHQQDYRSDHIHSQRRLHPALSRQPSTRRNPHMHSMFLCVHGDHAEPVGLDAQSAL